MYVLLLNTIRYVNELVNIIIMFVARVGGWGLGVGGWGLGGGGGVTPCDGLYGEAPHERGTSFRLQVYERVGI